jgi:Rieske 2Fe-2S family protein
MAKQSRRTSGGARALAGDYYTSSAIFAQEMQQLFSGRWLCTVHQSTLSQPGSHALYELAPTKPGAEPVPSESVLIVRGEDGEIRAFYNVCRHRGARLRQVGGQLPGNCIRCPYHAWTFALDGRLLGAPNMGDVAGFDRSEHPLIPVATAIWEGFVFINLAPAPVPFEQAFASVLGSFTAWQIPRLVVARQVTYEVAANWKLLFQNYSECYHCPTIHPALNQLTPYLGADNDHESGEILGGPMQIQQPEGSMTESGHLCGPALVSGAERMRVYYYTLFPNMFLSLHPDYVLVHRLDPLAIDRTRVVCEWLFDPGYREQAGANPEEAVWFWDRVNREDWQVCELAQQGVRSRGYLPGMYSELESTTAAFDRAYLEALEGAAR